MHFENEAEAYLAIASLVLSADKVGTMPERNYLFRHIHDMDLFRDLSATEFSSLMEYVNEKIFSAYDVPSGLFEPAGMQAFCAAIRNALPADRYGTAMRMACEMACADGLLRVEREVLDMLGRELGVSPVDVEEMLAV